MSSTATKDERAAAQGAGRGGSPWRRSWPAALGVLVAAGTVYGLGDGRDVAPVVAASGLVYLAAAVIGRAMAAWWMFAVTFVVVGVDKFFGVEGLPWLLGMAAVLAVVGLVARHDGPWWAFPLQTAAMVVCGSVAWIALRSEPVVGGLLVAAGLLGHAAWDLCHHRSGRVVGRSLAEFCMVLDVLLAAAVVWVVWV
ncbi:hypothetical protein ACQB6R_03125 [Propionibacteriaceae bacterium G1746]|uniref:hypothetical protein n=1 Tax=Aestuariimicrobium sp. G57 TaxID=3418485 RepID=UPI003C1F0F0F